jgi:restriction endonuclease
VVNLGLSEIINTIFCNDKFHCDSTVEKKLGDDFDTSDMVDLYIKLPNELFINTPMGKYNPEWAISFKEGSVKHIHFVAETKGYVSDLQLSEIEKAKKLGIEGQEGKFGSISGIG